MLEDGRLAHLALVATNGVLWKGERAKIAA
jgi:hypothetical protein